MDPLICMNKPSRRNYTEEFKREAVKLTEQVSRSVSDVVRSPGVHRSLIERWRREYGESSGVSKSILEAEREELKDYLDTIPIKVVNVRDGQPPYRLSSGTYISEMLPSR